MSFIERRARAEAEATRNWNFCRFGVDEKQLAQETEPIDKPVEKPRVVTKYQGMQPGIKFEPSVDFSKGGSIPF